MGSTLPRAIRHFSVKTKQTNPIYSVVAMSWILSFINIMIMETFQDCSTHNNNVDLLILEKIDEGGIDLISITTNNDADFNIIWLTKEDALRLAHSISSIANETCN